MSAARRIKVFLCSDNLRGLVGWIAKPHFAVNITEASSNMHTSNSSTLDTSYECPKPFVVHSMPFKINLESLA